MGYKIISSVFLLAYAAITGANVTKDKITEGLDSISAMTAFSNDPEKCYENHGLGCFSNSPPWSFLPLRPLPPPAHPDDVAVKMFLYTRKDPSSRYHVPLHPHLSLKGSDYKSDRPYTVFITHGFTYHGSETWMNDLKDAYLGKRDANVFIVDWGTGFKMFNYLQASSNTRIVAAELKRFMVYLMSKTGISPSKVHLMGHCLGSHIMAYAAKSIKGIKHLTAFDPAQPGFEGCPAKVRLDKGDAEFVEVIHTNALATIPFMGFGMINPYGHSDFYVNGGLSQPGCIMPPLAEIKIESFQDLATLPTETFSKWRCSHSRSYEYYTEAILHDNDCKFWGKDDGSLSKILNVTTSGVAQPVFDKFTTCSIDKCSPFGLESINWPARGTFIVFTNPKAPFCVTNPNMTAKMEHDLENFAGGETSIGTKLKEGFTKLVEIFTG